MTTDIDITTLAADLDTVINRVEAGECVRVIRSGQPIAMLVPMPAAPGVIPGPTFSEPLPPFTPLAGPSTQDLLDEDRGD